MTDVLTAVEAGIYTTLKANSTVASSVGGTVTPRIYKEQAPAATPTDYIVFFHVAGGDQNLTPTRSFDVDYQIEVWSLTSAGARALVGKIDDALRLNPFAITGFTINWCMPGALISSTENVEGKQFYRAGATWNIRGSQ